MSATPDSGSPASDKAALAYDRLDHFLRNNLDDADYADYSSALETVYASPPAALPDRCLSDSPVSDTQAALPIADKRQAALPDGWLGKAESLVERYLSASIRSETSDGGNGGRFDRATATARNALLSHLRLAEGR